MAELVALVLDDPKKVDEVFRAWLKAGVPGVTTIDSAGLRYHIGTGKMRDDLPLLPSLQSLLRQREEPHRLLFSIVPDDFDIDTLAAETEKITGNLNEPNTGILFIVPVRRAWGLHRRRQ